MTHSAADTTARRRRLDRQGHLHLQKPSGHPNHYGLVFGGANLGAATQSYVYFVVAQNGMYLVRQRNGDQATDVQARAAHASVVQLGADSKSVNALEVRVAGGTISYVVNGQVVHTMPKGTRRPAVWSACASTTSSTCWSRASTCRSAECRLGQARVGSMPSRPACPHAASKWRSFEYICENRSALAVMR